MWEVAGENIEQALFSSVKIIYDTTLEFVTGKYANHQTVKIHTTFNSNDIANTIHWINTSL